MRDEHQEDCGGLLDGLGEDQVGTKEGDVQPLGEKRPLSPSATAAEDAKKARLIPPPRINVGVANQRGGESMVAFNSTQFRICMRMCEI